MESQVSISNKFNGLHGQIMNNDSEFWEVRNKAVQGLTDLISTFEGYPLLRIQEIFNPSVSRMLKDIVKEMITDLRSQQVREICTFLVRLSSVAKDHSKLLFRELFPFILDGVKVPNRVMSGYVDNAILAMIKNTIFKSCLPILVLEIKESKAKLVREHCLVRLYNCTRILFE